MSVGSLQAEIPPAVGVEASGTLDKNVTSLLESSNTSESPMQDSSIADHAEQALESHEVVELQAFSKRKEWIVDKIKFLENMPPIELFVGLDAIRTSADIIPGLPTRAELQQWLIEHDKIEKETELFDSGELKKFKQFTKATAKRNLSPEDTDLIELTLTTIYEFDKLLHLLRDRSENLDLLGIRLTWEEQRATAWVERRKLLADLQAFLSGRSRWSPAVYETAGKPEEPSPSSSTRRGSIMSIASDSSYSSSPGFSRSARFILAEALSKDAAQFAGRISSLRHTKISAAGKALDKLIDHSRKPVPEEFLDEQDKLEDHGINELENVGKFVMDVVTQWRKADEFYVETVKDQAAARMLYEEIETAKLSHPSARQDTLYTSRASAIGRRLLSRKNPAVSGNGFPKPSHPLFPDQKESNKHITQLLQSELTAAIDQARKVEQSAQDYHAAFETVKRVEALCSSARALFERYSSIMERLQNGVSATDGDGTPPDLSTHQCLDPTQHSTFLALLPSLLQEAQDADDEAKILVPKARAALLGTNEIQVDPIFHSDSLAAVDNLTSLMASLNEVREDVASRASLLRDARKLWSSAEVIVRELELVRGSADESMQRNHWRHQSTSTASGQPLTPESPRSPSISSSMSTENALETLAQLEVKLSQEVLTRFSSLAISPDAELRTYMSQSFEGLSITLSQVKRFVHLSENVQQQALVMSTVRSEMHDLQLRLEVLKDGFEQLTDGVLNDQMPVESLDETELKLVEDAHVLQEAVQEFTSSLPHRILFVAPDALKGNFLPVKRRFSVTGNVTLDSLKLNSQLELPFDLSSLDDVVRTDCNAFSLNLTGAISSLDRKRQYLRAAHLAKEVDKQLEVLTTDVHSAAEEVETLRGRLHDSTHDLDSFESLLADTSRFFDSRRPELARSFSPIRELLRNIDALPGVWDVTSDKGLLMGRIHAVDDAELELKALFEGLSSLKSQISEMRRTEELRIEEQRLQAQRLEEQRLEAQRLEEERLETQRFKEQRLEQEQLEQEQLEQERLEQERLAERRLEEQRLEKQRLEEQRLEEQRLAEEKPRSEALRAAELKQQAEDDSSYGWFRS
ncbi:hypothetical protein EWM64_g3731 [Hericium alpestre]|uniref:Uncharacterized protein n=1 Tax=Hericium alpestre TaxID=135208 RepID=A0A4Z0A0M2_9AGAM|nr:hypothetical protein EWM64_g3731 [Hericium alpestre]